MAGRGEERALRLVRFLGDLTCVLRVAEQPCVLDRDRRLLGQADQEAEIRIREVVRRP